MKKNSGTYQDTDKASETLMRQVVRIRHRQSGERANATINQYKKIWTSSPDQVFNIRYKDRIKKVKVSCANDFKKFSAELTFWCVDDNKLMGELVVKIDSHELVSIAVHSDYRNYDMETSMLSHYVSNTGEIKIPDVALMSHYTNTALQNLKQLPGFISTHVDNLSIIKSNKQE